MININPKHYEIIKYILKKYPYNFYAFGSRVKNNNQKLSDLDLCFFENIPYNVLSRIEEDFEESNLPYKIDLVNWNDCSVEFKFLIKPDLTCIQQKNQKTEF